MQILDVVLPQAAEAVVSEAVPIRPECFIGARPRTQCLDVAQGLQYIIEKGINEFGHAAVAQAAM